MGASTGTATVNNAIFSLPNATAINATSAKTSIANLLVTRPLALGAAGQSVAIFNQAENEDIITASASGTTRFTVANNGDLITTGGLTAAGNAALNGGSLTTTATTGNVFNTTATTLNIGGAATSISVGAATGITTVNNALTVGGDLTASKNVTFSPGGSSSITFNTGSSNPLYITGLPTVTGNLVCVNASTGQVSQCASNAISLQSAYNGGNTITTGNNDNIAFTLANTSTASNFTVNTANGSNGYSIFSLGAGGSATVPNELIQVDNQNASNTLPTGIKVTSSGGGSITTGIDLSDPNIVTAIAIGAGNIAGTNFSVNGTNGNITSSGNLALNGGSLTTTAATANVFNANATTANAFGAATTLNIGATSGTATINNATISLPHATAINAANATGNLNALNVGGGYGSTGSTFDNTGDIQAKGNLTIDGTSTLTGDITSSGNLALNGGSLTTTAATANVFNANATTLNIGGAATSISVGAGTGTTTVNNALTVSGDLTAYGNDTFTPSGSDAITFNTGTSNPLYVTGLPTVTGNLVCVNTSTGQITECASNAISLQSAYNGGNTITTSNNDNIAFTLANTATASNFTVTTANGSTGYSYFSLGAGANATVPNQLIKVDNQNASNTLPTGIKVTSSGGSPITTGIDLSDPNIVTAIAIGAGNIAGTKLLSERN